MPNSNQAAVSVVLAAAVLAAVGTLAYPLFADDHAAKSDPAVPARLPAAATAPPPGADAAQPSENISQFLAAHSPTSAVEPAKPTATPVTAPATPAGAPPAMAAAPAAAPVAAPVAAPATPAVTLPPPAPPGTAALAEAPSAGETRIQLRMRLRREALAARRAAQDAATENLGVPVAAKLMPAERIAAEPAPHHKVTEPQAAPAARKAAGAAGGWEEVASGPEKPAAPRRDMTVVVSGDRAWVQVDSKHTVTVKAGDVLPGMGRVVEIRDNKVVTEKGTLNSN